MPENESNTATPPVDVPRLVRCSGCNCEITPGLESPEQGVCGVCLVYLEDLRNEEAAREQRQIITREMAMDAGCPEMEGCEW